MRRPVSRRPELQICSKPHRDFCMTVSRTTEGVNVVGLAPLRRSAPPTRIGEFRRARDSPGSTPGTYCTSVAPSAGPGHADTRPFGAADERGHRRSRSSAAGGVQSRLRWIPEQPSARGVSTRHAGHCSRERPTDMRFPRAGRSGRRHTSRHRRRDLRTVRLRSRRPEPSARVRRHRLHHSTEPQRPSLHVIIAGTDRAWTCSPDMSALWCGFVCVYGRPGCE